jgi:hypothetical protein
MNERVFVIVLLVVVACCQSLFCYSYANAPVQKELAAQVGTAAEASQMNECVCYCAVGCHCLLSVISRYSYANALVQKELAAQLGH